ncbi:MAG: FAD-dependent oxidoreductase [Synergistaceae bacterium]|nr:FAD-dependent oxidoreductase [Synergistaceae bacterium]
MKVLIIGGVAGGATAAARLRRLDEKAEIIMFDKGPYVSYAACGLPYFLDDRIIHDRNKLIVRTPEQFAKKNNIEAKVNNRVTSIDRENKKVEVEDLETGKKYTESYDKLIISTGASPFRPNIPGIDTDGVFTLWDIPDAVKIKEYIKEKNVKKVVIVGGGAIGLEVAENLTETGMEITIVELSDHLIAPLDADMALPVLKYVREKGIEVILNDGVTAIEKRDDGFTVKLSESGIDADMILMSVGARPQGELAKEAGLIVNERGFIKVDEHMRTSDPDIFAVGDVTEVKNFITGQPASVALAGPANKQGRIAADNIAGINSRYGGIQGTGALKIFDMTVAFTGLSEKEAQKNGLNYDKVLIYHYPHAGYYPGGQEMAIKIVFEVPTGRILGAQITGYTGVDKRCDVLAASIRMGADAHDLTELELAYSPPFGTPKDAVNTAGFVIENILAGKLQKAEWSSIEGMPDEEEAIFIDVRGDDDISVSSVKIDGFQRIPLEELRGRLSQLDKSKPVYVHCRNGKEGYYAACLMRQEGFDVSNLDGGCLFRDCSICSSETKP